MPDHDPILSWQDADRLIDAATIEIADNEALPLDPVVTIGILCYQHAGTVREAVDSALGQEASFPFEIVIADDGSTDGAAAIVEALQRQHPDRIRLLLARENLGRHTGNGRLNLVRLWRANRGRYFHLLDGDDYWTDTAKLARQVAFLEEHRECALCWHRGRVLYDAEVPEEGKLMGDVYPPGDFEPVNDGSMLFWGNPCLTSSVLYRRGVCEELPFDFLGLRIGDWPLIVLHAREGMAGFLDAEMSAYRFHMAGMWSRQSRFDQALGLLHTMAQVYEWIPSRHRVRFAENLGETMAGGFSLTPPRPLGARPARSCAIMTEILQLPGVESAFAEALERRCEKVAWKSEERERKLREAREKIAALKAKLAGFRQERDRLRAKSPGFLRSLLRRRRPK